MDRLDRFFDHPLMLSFTILIYTSLFFRRSPGPHNDTMAHRDSTKGLCALISLFLINDGQQHFLGET